MPLLVACTQIGLSSWLQLPEQKASAERAALLFAMGQEAGRAGLVNLPSKRKLDPLVALHLTVCEWFCGETFAAEVLLKLALASGLLAAVSQSLGGITDFAGRLNQLPTRSAWVGLVLLVARQFTLCNRLLAQEGALTPAMEPLTAADRQLLARCLSWLAASGAAQGA